MREPRAPLFLARRGYRRRRLQDAARLLPLAGAVLFALPFLQAETARTTGGGLVYLFAAWVTLIVAAAVLARALSRGTGDAAREETGRGDGAREHEADRP